MTNADCIRRMSRYIDVEWLKIALELYRAVDLSDAPSIDIVQCGECKHRQKDVGMGDHRWCDVVNGSRRSDDFCSYGERKDNE